MTTIDTGATHGTATPFPTARLAGLFARLSDAWTRRAARRATIRALDHLSDRDLDDIGLTRGDVDNLR